jgi:hypothetical protein
MIPTSNYVFPLNELRFIHSESGQACFGMAFPPFLMKQLHRYDSVFIPSLVGTGYKHEIVRVTVKVGEAVCSMTHRWTAGRTWTD